MINQFLKKKPHKEWDMSWNYVKIICFIKEFLFDNLLSVSLKELSFIRFKYNVYIIRLTL